MTSPTGFSERYERHHATAYRAALAGIEEYGDGGETEDSPRNPDYFREGV